VRFLKRFAQDLGLGLGWRPELAHFITKQEDLAFVEVIAENLDSKGALPQPIAELRQRGVCVIPHGVTLSLGGADPISPKRVEHLARLAENLGAPLVTEHIAFVRTGGVEIGHLTPLPRTHEALDVLVDNIERAKRLLPVPLALENIATLFDWPDAEMEEWQFVTAVLERTDSLLLLDISNAYANGHNRRLDALAEVLRLPLDRLTYAHMGGGIEVDGIVHDTHGDNMLPGSVELLRRFCEVKTLPGVMLERDENFPGSAEIRGELDRIKEAIASKPACAD